METSISSLTKRVRITTPFKARSVETDALVFFPKGTLLWHVMIAGDLVHLQEAGGQTVYEVPEHEFTPRVKNIPK